MSVTSYTAMPLHTTFLYPTSKQYPVDEVCEKIVRALEKRNWKVPGIEVEFDDYGTGELKFRHVWRIKGEDFKLWFCRFQGSIYGRRIDTAAISEIVIPERELHVNEDESGPTYYTYVGGNWEEDKDRFMNGRKIDSKLDGGPRTYLKYSGGNDRRRSHLLMNDTFLGREYKAREGEPKQFSTEDVFREVEEWLNVNVLTKIQSFDEATEVDLTTESSIPYPEHLGPFYVITDWNTYNRIVKGKEDKNQLKPSERYALRGEGPRLVAWGIRNDGTVPKEAYDGFLYCRFERPKFEEDDTRLAVLRINPKNANNIFIADRAPGIEYMRKCFAVHPNKRSLTDEELAELDRCRGRTLVGIHQYRGDYKKPMVLIRHSRELSFDEVEIVDVSPNMGNHFKIEG